jgi:predicted enzyme involved in methoxymalonyl-ACP biosynthesis
MDSYGLIGVLICRAISLDAWEVDTWLMSCRALGRQMEKFMFDRMIEAAIARDFNRLVGVYRSTAKNDLVKDLYDQLGFRRVGEAQDQVRYELKVPETPTVSAKHIRNITAHRVGASAHAGRPGRPSADGFTQRTPDEHQPSG